MTSQHEEHLRELDNFAAAIERDLSHAGSELSYSEGMDLARTFVEDGGRPSTIAQLLARARSISVVGRYGQSRDAANRVAEWIRDPDRWRRILANQSESEDRTSSTMGGS